MKRRKSSITGEFVVPVFKNLLFAQLLEFVFGERVVEQEERVGKLILDGEVPNVLDP